MARLRTELLLPLDAPNARWAVVRGIAQGGWNVDRDEPGLMSLHESNTAAHWPLHIEIEWDPASAAPTVLRLSAKAFGIGPIQSRHIRERIGALRTGIEAASLDMARPS
jgi:hypothetical protein